MERAAEEAAADGQATVGAARVSAPTLRIRAFDDGDEERLYDVFRSSIHTHAAGDHSPEQIEAWAPTDVDAALAARWIERMRAIRPFIVEARGRDGDAIAAYADLQPDGYIDHFFVAGGFGGRGVGAHLMNHLLAQARLRDLSVLTSDVSVTARRFFARFGFEIVERKTVELRGVRFENARMRLDRNAGRDGR